MILKAGEPIMLKPAGSRLASFAVVLIVTSSLAVNVEITRAAPPDVAEQARGLLDRIGVDRGICVLLAPGPAELAVAMARQSELTVYVQLPTDDAVAEARRAVDAADVLGTRVYVEKGDWARLHLATSLADAVVVVPAATEAAKACQEELVRVVRPLGKILLGDREITKPYPAEADDWTHAYHGPDNNPQSTDRLARAPYLTQFLAEPWYVPFPEVTVTSAGRMFKAFGHVGYKRRNWPWTNTLVAINGYNGTLLWQRPLEPGFNIHRNTMIATPEILYLADSKSCKLLDTATGDLKDEITVPEGATGPVWKWMAAEDGVLYALVGEKEFHDETLRGTRTAAGWPWRPMTPGYDQPDYHWGFGRTLFALDLKTKEVLWTHVEKEPIDGRAVAMTGGRIYYYSHPNFLACLDAKQGKPLWRNSDPKLLEAIGPHHRAQTARLGFASTAYLKCSGEAVYFAGPQRPRLVAASAEDGRLLWQLPHGNYQLVLRQQGLYAMGRTAPSRLLDPFTGEVRADLNCIRGNCTRATGTVDSIFCRGHDHAGTLRLTVPDHQPRRIALMRPDCHDGVIAAGGLLYWGPWMCDCSLSLVGNICLAPAGDFDFGAAATEAERLESTPNAQEPVKLLEVAPGDWPAYRADNGRSAAAEVDIAEKVALAWDYTPPEEVDTTAPVTAGGLVFVGGSDGVVRALDAESGTCRWKSYTGGPILYPPAVDEGRLVVASGDGWVYAFEAAAGQLLWRFRAAPAERKINLYGRLASTWPVASGVLVDEGVVYAAAGIASYDGTHVYALDAATGRIRWQNNTSGHLFGEDRVTGVSVQGHLLLHDGRLYMAGGNVISPAAYDLRNGRLLGRLVDEWGGQKPPADPNWEYTDEVQRREREQKELGKSPRGCDLFLVDGQVVAFDRLLYAPKEHWVGRYFPGQLLQAGSGDVLIRSVDDRVVRIAPKSGNDAGPKAVWDVQGFEEPRAMALGTNAVLIGGRLAGSDPEDAKYAVAARAVADGQLVWSQPLP
ncbi:MAG: PQQ-binding-like beta-propeller repeat protein, partial [Planctomycetota bacterium]